MSVKFTDIAAYIEDIFFNLEGLARLRSWGSKLPFSKIP